MTVQKLIVTLTCPYCDHKQKEEMSKIGCLHFYKCKGCMKLVSSKDKCVFCAYGNKKCPSGCL